MGRGVTLKSGLALPPIGFGTWRLGEDSARSEDEIAALRRAVELGFMHIDTAEMYGDGATERLVGQAISGMQRDALILTSKVYPWNAGRTDMIAACEGSLKRLGTDYLDLYLLHWPGSVPIAETLAGAEALLAAGKIRAFGVSNFDSDDLARVLAVGSGVAIEINQVMYNPARRGIEWDLLPLMQREGIVCVAYTPIEPGRVARNPGFAQLAAEAALTPAELALAWHVTRGAAIPIPKAGTVAHVESLHRAAEIRLDAATLAGIDAVFPPPDGPSRLDIL